MAHYILHGSMETDKVFVYATRDEYDNFVKNSSKVRVKFVHDMWHEEGDTFVYKIAIRYSELLTHIREGQRFDSIKSLCSTVERRHKAYLKKCES